MKKTGVIAVISLAALLAGCGQTPTTSIETENTMLILEAAESGFGSSSTLADYEAPESFTGNWTGLDGCLSVKADAVIELPETDALPVATVERRAFTQTDADRLLEVFLKGNTLYKELGATKQEVEARLEKYRAMERGEIPLELDGERTMEDLPEIIKRWEQYAAEAPEEGERIEAETAFQDGGYWHELIQGWSEVEGSARPLHAVIANSPNSSEAVFWLDGYGDWNGAYAQPAPEIEAPEELEPGITEAEALRMGDELMAELGLENVVCDVIEPVFYSLNYSGLGYRLEYVRTVAGIPIAYSEYPGTAVPENVSGDMLWGYERISVCTGQDGVVYFKWENPHTVPVIEKADVQLMAFSDIYDIFGKMVMIKNSYIEAANNANSFDVIHSMEVDRVELNLMRIRDKDDFEKGLIVPVWDFRGTSSAHAADEAYSQYVYDGEYYETILTINAVDGTLIDREIGY